MASENRALIFDFDGVLADTEPLIWKAWASLLEPYHVPFSWEDYCHFGRGIKDEPMLRRIPQLLANPSLLVKLIDQADTAQQIVQRWVEECPPIPATTIAMFRTLRDFRIGLVTSSQRAEVEPVLQKAGILECFHALVAAEDTVRHKPDPEPYLLVGKRLGLARGLVFEDSEPGLESATAAGWTAVRVDDPDHLSQIVAASLATFVS